ncbi:RhoGAP-domain-containing protein [Trametopsis cervina]|nr:RhoGAP-domain-containing protein [Trametopsis cervina]
MGITDQPAANVTPVSDPSLLSEQRICPGCKQAVVTENGGVVVAFGQSFFHIECFKCAKCGNQVTADTNLLLLSDGSPVCADCSYSCNVCGQPILDEAIMTGEDSYHAHCFNCRVCKKRIDELVFAKTSQGIYCMPCHSERVARSRKHQERREREKRERERRAGGGAGGGVSGGTSGGTMKAGPSSSTDPGTNTTSSPPVVPAQSYEQTAAAAAATQPISGSSGRPGTGNSQHRAGTPRSSEFPAGATSTPKTIPASSSSSRVPSPSAASQNGKRYSNLMIGRPASPVVPYEPGRSLTTPLSNMENLTATAPSDAPSKTLQKAKSYDDRALNAVAQEALMLQNADPSSLAPNGLLLPSGGGTTGRREKRRSINPGVAMTFNVPFEDTVRGSNNSNPFSSAPNTPLGMHPLERPATPSKQDSPLREYVPNNTLVASPPPISREQENGRAQNSSVTRLQLDAAAAEQDRPPFGRSRSASSTEQPAVAMAAPLRSPMRMSFTLDRVPQRTTSRPEHRGESPGLYADAAGRHTPQLAPDGRDSPNGRSSPMGLALQRSFDARNRSSTSSLGQTMELPPRSGGASRPTSPAHRVDVPRGVESGTDTEAEGEEETYVSGNTSVRDSLPPLPPPKETKGMKAGTRPPNLKLDTAHVDLEDRGDNSLVDSEEMSEDFSHEEEPVETTSHSTYIAPALPPIRFSMVGTDFLDILKNVDGSPHAAAVAAVTSGGKTNGLKLDLHVTAPETSSASVAGNKDADPTLVLPQTPTGNQTMFAVDTTPVQQRREPSVTRTLNGRADNVTDTPRKPENGGATMLRSISTPEPHPRDAKQPTFQQYRQRDHSASDASLAAPSGLASPAQITVTPPEAGKTGHIRPEMADVVVRRLREALQDTRDRGVSHVKMDTELVEAILSLLQQRQEESHDLKHRLDGVKRTSQQVMEGLTVAQTQYDKEQQARRDAEAEVARLRVLLSGQAVRLAAVSGETIRQEAQKQLSQELSDNLSTLERSLSQLKLQRDMALAEVEELSASKSTQSMMSEADSAGRFSRALSLRFDNIKNQYQGELLPLTKQKESINREIAELKAMRDAVLAETTAISARNEALAQLHAQYASRASSDHSHESDKRDESFENGRSGVVASITSSTTAYSDESSDQKWVKPSKPEVPEQIVHSIKPKFMKWPGSKTQPQPVNARDVHAVIPDVSKPKTRVEHVFQQISVLRVGRCEHCGDKMWGSQLRCGVCNISVHTRCGHLVHSHCSQHGASDASSMSMAPVGPSLFGRDLAEQVQADSKDEERVVPVIVEKCIDAVDTLALDYEGIYRKTGGSGQSKTITQLFERGDYNSFDLRDSDRFNDICSVTSVLKNYFRALPDPLLTYDLHDQFITAATMKDPEGKSAMLADLVTKLPAEHYNTTRALMLHLHRVSQLSDQNLMHARNLGVVFGPTLMRSRDPAAEFSDMAGKALTVEWLVENALSIFQP